MSRQEPARVDWKRRVFVWTLDHPAIYYGSAILAGLLLALVTR